MSYTGYRQFLIILAAATVPAGCMALWDHWQPAKSLQLGEISASEAISLPQQQVLYVDARPKAFYERNHLPGAIPLNQNEWSSLIPLFYDAWVPEKIVVIYGRPRSDEAKDVALRLQEESGVPNTRVLREPWDALRK